MTAGKLLVMTGGGTAGHVTPNLALVPALRNRGWEIAYIGSHHGIERRLIEAQNIPYYAIASGKLRRYFDWQNFIDPFKVLWGIGQAYWLLRQLRPAAVFSKGGFVTVPVMVAAKLCGIPAIAHESDITPGLANKLALPFATTVCVTFPETLKYIPRALHTGLPIRAELLAGSRDRGRAFCGLSASDRSPARPILLVVGGSSGAARINQAIGAILDDLTATFFVVHVCGKGNVDPDRDRPGYRQFDYLGDELADVLAAADLVVSRAGANTMFELLALRKPHLLIPLSRAASRGDQILNARSFARAGYSAVLPEENLTPATLRDAIATTYAQRHAYQERMGDRGLPDAIAATIAAIEQAAAPRRC